MKFFLFLSSVLFISFCESLPVSSVPSVPVSGKKVERFIDEIGKTLTVEHQNALKLVKSQQAISLIKKQKLDLLSSEFNSLRIKLNNITETYNQYQKERNSALSDYSVFNNNFQKVQKLIDKNKIDYENEIRFLNEIKSYIKKVNNSKCYSNLSLK